MATKNKVHRAPANPGRRQQNSPQDREDNRKFMTVLAVSTVVLMLLMYFIFQANN